MPGSMVESTCRRLSRRRCRSWSPIRLFDRTGPALHHVGPCGAGNWLRATSSEPCLDLAKIPNHASWGQREAPRKFSPLFHFINCAVGKRDEYREVVYGE